MASHIGIDTSDLALEVLYLFISIFYNISFVQSTLLLSHFISSSLLGWVFQTVPGKYEFLRYNIRCVGIPTPILGPTTHFMHD